MGSCHLRGKSLFVGHMDEVCYMLVQNSQYMGMHACMIAPCQWIVGLLVASCREAIFWWTKSTVEFMTSSFRDAILIAERENIEPVFLCYIFLQILEQNVYIPEGRISQNPKENIAFCSAGWRVHAPVVNSIAVYIYLSLLWCPMYNCMRSFPNKARQANAMNCGYTVRLGQLTT